MVNSVAFVIKSVLEHRLHSLYKKKLAIKLLNVMLNPDYVKLIQENKVKLSHFVKINKSRMTAITKANKHSE